jgi:hypothetical protein
MAVFTDNKVIATQNLNFMIEGIVNSSDNRNQNLIYYQKTPDRLIFANNQNLTNNIVAWQKTVVIDEKTVNDLMNSATGTPSLIFEFIFLNEQRIHSRIYHPIVQAGFEGSCDCIKTDLLERQEERDHPHTSINQQMYNCLQNWQHWVEEEALTSRYVYRFYDNSTYGLEWATIYDLKTTESVCIGHNPYTDRIFVNKSLPEILGADYW